MHGIGLGETLFGNNGFFMNVIRAGWFALTDYLSAHVITCLVPAFFIAGAITILISQDKVLKYFGEQTKKVVSYTIASISGAILAVCSCTVLPLFSGIYKRGAGIGPAIAFLYSGPAINILAITYTAKLLGLDIGVSRAVGAILFSVVIGLIMALIFPAHREENRAMFTSSFEVKSKRSEVVNILFFVFLVLVLIFASSKHWVLLGISLLVVIGITVRYIRKDEFKLWMKSTWDFFLQIFPLLLLGVFIAGIIKFFVPPEFIARWVGSNTVSANLIASVIGAFSYFATLTEVPIVKALMDLGMSKGPALALLLAGPSLSLPNMIVISRIMGLKKATVYIGLVVVMASTTGLIVGRFI